MSLLPVCGKILERLIYNKMFEAGGVFLDISKEFDKAWHEDLLCKLKQNGIASNLLFFVSEKTESCFKWAALVML